MVLVWRLFVTKRLTVRICVRNFENLIPDAPELIHDFLVNEKDASCKRNAFMMLIHADQVCSVCSNRQRGLVPEDLVTL